MPVCWNWQTRRTQNPLVAIPCGFDPRHRHQTNIIQTASFLFEKCLFAILEIFVKLHEKNNP